MCVEIDPDGDKFLFRKDMEIGTKLSLWSARKMLQAAGTGLKAVRLTDSAVTYKIELPVKR